MLPSQEGGGRLGRYNADLRPITRRELSEIRKAPKSIDITLDELLDRSSMQTPDTDRNLRRGIDVRCREYTLMLSLRETKTNPADSSVLMILKVDGFDR